MYTLTEIVPAGWTVGVISQGGSYDASKHWVRWLFMDNLARVVTFQLTQSSGSPTNAVLRGEASFDGMAVTITGLGVLPLQPPPSGVVVRQLPSAYRAGQTASVTLHVMPESDVGLYGVEEIVPRGWLPVNLGGGSLTAGGVIKWGPFPESTPRDLSYTLTAPAGAMSNVVFRGTGWFDTTAVTTGGDALMVAAPLDGGSVSRTLPAQYQSGETVTVTLRVEPNQGTEVQAVLEMLPAGWVATNISDFGVISADGQTVRWGPYLDADSRTLAYKAMAPPAARSNAVFSGVGQFGVVSVTTLGQVDIPWRSAESGTITRVLPANCRPGQSFWITNLVAPNAMVGTYAVEESLPAGWTVVQVGGGSYLAPSHSVRWGPVFDNKTNWIVWQVMVPTNATGTVSFSGMAWFGNAVVTVGGSSSLDVIPPSQGVAFRSLPEFFRPGRGFTVTNTVQPGAGVGFCVVEERVPAGWTVTNISHAGFFLPELNLLRWGPFTDDEARTLTFTVVPPATAQGSVSFGGQAFFDKAQTTILGATGMLMAKATPTVITWPGATTIRSGQLLPTSILSGGSASVLGEYSFKDSGVIPRPGTYSATVVFTPTDTLNYYTLEGSVSMKVAYVSVANGLLADPETWGGWVPEAGDDVVVADGMIVTIQDGSPVLNNLTVEGRLSLGSNTLQLIGNFTNNGTFTAGTGTVELTGSNAQYLAATASGGLNFNRLTVNKSRSTDLVTSTGKLAVSGRLGINKGKLLSASDYRDIEIGAEGELVLASPITVSGNLTNSGTVTTSGNTITFDAGVEQYLVLNVMTRFEGITVSTNTTLIEIAGADNAIVTGAILNQGLIRKTQPVSGTGQYHFGLAGGYNRADMEIDVRARAGLDPVTSLRVERVDANQPSWPNTNVSAIYWKITVTGTNCLAAVTLPQAGLPDPRICRYQGGRWDWTRTTFDGTIVAGGVLTQTSDWVVYNDPKPIATVTTVGTSTASPTYGDNVTFTATVSPAVATGTVTFKDGMVVVGTSVLNGAEATWNMSVLAAGSHSITAVYSGDTSYAAGTSTALTQTVAKAMLFAKTDGQTRYYGRVNPELTISYSGWLNGDATSLLTTVPTCTTPGVQSSLVGEYQITAAGGASSNYNFTYVPATLTVTKAPLLVVGDDAARYYGRPNPIFTAVATGITNNDSITVELNTTVTNTSPVGRYRIFLMLNDPASRLGQYAVVLRSAILTVEPGLLLGTVSSGTRPYAGTNHPFSVTYSGWQNGEGTNLLEGTLEYACTNHLGENVDSTTSIGVYPIRVVTEQTTTNYAVSYMDGTQTISPVALNVTGNNATRVYGAPNPTLTGTVVGVMNNDNITGAYSTRAMPQSFTGVYDIAPSFIDPQARLGNYILTTNLGTLSITKAPLSVIVNGKSRPYGAANPALTGIITGLVNSDAITPGYSTAASVLSSVGSYDIVAALNDPGNKLGNYSITNVSGTITITKAPLGVTADNKSRAYGTTNPILTVSYNGFVNSETYTTLGASLSLTTEATTASPAGTYTITASGYTSGNYDISYTNGTLTVGSATLTVSGDDKSRVYGAANPTLTGTLVGVVSGDSITAAWSTTATNNSVVGTYAISPVWTDPDGKLGNYIITTNLGTLSITKAALTVTADNQSRSYGDDNPVLTISYNGFAEGDTASSLTTQPICNVSATLSTIPGTYTITASGASSSNYTITYVNGTLTVGKALLVIIGDDAMRSYGRTNPVFTASIVGIKNGDNLTFDYYTEATTRSLPGKYYIEIRIGGGDGKIVNYEVLMVGGRVTVNPAVLTGTIGSQSRGYGQNNSPFTLVYSGFVYPEDTNLITGTVTLAAKTGGGATVTLATAPGTYAIKATAQQSLANYTVSYVDGTLAVTQVELMVTGNNATRVYGSSNPTLTASTAGFVNNETASVLGGSLSVTTPATVTSPSGSYAVSPGGYTSVNYAIRYVDGALTVTKAPLAGEITSSARAYGRSNTAYAVTYTGWLNGDTTNVLGSGPGFSCVDTNTTIDITNNTPIGSYVVKAVGAPAATNYSITIADGTLAITQAVLTATADNGSRTYGASNPGLTGTLTGVVDGDNITAIYGTTAIGTSPAGRYDIVPGLVDPGGKLTNYLASITSGTLNINKAALVVAADNQSRAYGASNPTLSVGYSGFVNGDSATTLGGTLSMSTPAAASSPIGTYAITASGQTSANYHISYTGGTLTVGKGTMVATADNLSRTYGAANPVLTGTLTGMVPWDNITVSYSTIATQAIGVGAYAIVTTLSDPDGKLENYNVTRSDGTFTVNKASLVARADNLSRTYGSLNPHLTQRYTGFLNGEDSLVLTTIPTLETTATTMSPVGTYEITMTGGSAANYEITRTSGTLAINRAAITVVADNKIRTYGTANPSLTGTLSGVLNGDNITAFYGTTATISSPAGTYAIVPGLLDLTSKLGNYTTTLTNGVLTVKGDDAPVVTLTGYPWLYTVGTAASLVDTNATVTDGGSPNFDGGTLTVGVSANGNVLDTLSYQTQGQGAGQIGRTGTGVTCGGLLIATVAGGTATTPLVFSLNTNATPATVQALLRAVTLETDDRSTNSRTLRVVVADGDGGLSTPVTKVLALNRPPVAGPDTFSVALNGILTNTIGSVLSNDTDADGDTVVLESLSGVSANGGRITQVGTNLIYRAPLGYRGADLFAYLIGDGRGGSVPGIMTVNVGFSCTLTLNNSVNGMTVHLVGEVGKTYRVEGTSNMVQWSVIGKVAVSPDGTAEVLDANAKNLSQRFYRAVQE